MIYVALLRGINVGGNNRVEMKRLKSSFEEVGLKNVKTYINSGNVIFSDTRYSVEKLVILLEKEIEKDFGFTIKVLLRDLTNLKTVLKALPADWTNDADHKCDVMFLWESSNHPKILDQLHIQKDIEEVKYVSGAVLWFIDRKNINRSKMLKIVGTKLYKEMTVRNCNTFRTLVRLMQEVE